jgi:hypothetical protein
VEFEECHWNFGRYYIEHTIAFVSIIIFTIFILLIHKHGVSLNLLMSSLISFFSDLLFSLLAWAHSSLNSALRILIFMLL